MSTGGRILVTPRSLFEAGLDAVAVRNLLAALEEEAT
jgi:hypothetical protein